MLAQYEVRTTLATWNQKWVRFLLCDFCIGLNICQLFVVHKFVTKPTSKNSKKVPAKPAESPDKSAENITMPPSAAPADATTSVVHTPFSSTPITSSTQGTSSALKAAAASFTTSEEPDGAILHTIAVSEVCFKVGRITIPPALVLATNGLSAPPSEFGSLLASYSRTNPPPHWPKAKALISVPAGGSPKATREFLVSKWKEIPESDRWWDTAFCGAVEQKRKARLEIVGGLRHGMEGVQGLTSN
jgi:hypothetical protein